MITSRDFRDSALETVLFQKLIPYATIAALVSIIGFVVLLTTYGSSFGLAGYDAPLLNWMLSIRSDVLTAIMLVTTNILSPIGATLATIMLAGYWMFRAKELWRPLLLGVSMAAIGIITSIMKLAFERSRPALDAMVPPIETTFAFPSGHTTAVAGFTFIATYLLLSRRYSRKLCGVLVAASLIAVAIVSFTRIYLGYHWLTDIVAAVFLVVIILAIVIFADSRHQMRLRRAKS